MVACLRTASEEAYRRRQPGNLRGAEAEGGGSVTDPHVAGIAKHLMELCSGREEALAKARAIVEHLTPE